MSILIKGMEMPKNCLLCPFGDEFGKCCVNAELEDANELTHTCPLIELSDHGDLIDRDALPKSIKYTGYALSANDVVNAVINAKAVIPAERSEE